MKKLTEYGQWAITLGATDGIGKAFCEFFAQNGMNVVLVGRRKELLEQLAQELSTKYGVKTLPVAQDLMAADAPEQIYAQTKDLDIGIFNYVGTYHKMGRYERVTEEDLMKIIAINITTYAKMLHHYTSEFSARQRGAIVTMSSLTGVTASPYNDMYGATKAFQQKLTEGVAYELKDRNVDCIVIIAGSTSTPDSLNNKPGGDAADSEFMTPEAVVIEGMEALGVERSYVVGEHNRQAYDYFTKTLTRDGAAALMGSYFEEQYK